MLPMKTLWRKIYQIFTLTISLCLLTTALGCSSAPTVGPTVPTNPTEPTEPAVKNEPANVTVINQKDGKPYTVFITITEPTTSE